VASDSARAVIVNETLVRDFGFENPIGQTVPPGRNPDEAPLIIGVVKDYHAQSLYHKIGPVILTADPGWQYENLLVRIRPEGIPQTLGLLKETWQAAVPDVPFAYRFLDEQMETSYANDRRWSEIIRYAALFALLIACLGLLGLAALTVTRRTKEIGIRKVLGATASHIVVLISKEFALLMVLGAVVASPLAYLAMQRWLQDFAYQAPLSWWIFAAAGLAAIGVALLTVGYLATRSAKSDPVRSLRYE
jgi:putative ABC transport system permease protein